MSDQERIDALQRDLNALKVDVALLAARVTQLQAEAQRRPQPVATRNGWPVVG